MARTEIKARNVTGADLIVIDLTDAVLPSDFPQVDVTISDTNSFDKISSSVKLREAIDADQVVLTVNGVLLSKVASLQFLDKTKNIAKWNVVSITAADSPYSASPNDFIIGDTSSGNIIILLPELALEDVNGNDICIFRLDTTFTPNNLILCAAFVGESINAGSTIALRSQYECHTLTASSANLSWADRISGKSPWAFTFVDSTWAATVGEYIEANPTVSPFNIEFPDATLYKGFDIKIKKMTASANAVTLVAFGAQLIEGVATLDMTIENQCRTFTSNGIGWSATSGYL